MADFILRSLRGGMNDSDPPLSLPDDQCIAATNVEWIESMVGERRRGCTAIEVASSAFYGYDRVTFLARHLPTSDETGSELWALGVSGTVTSVMARKTTVWASVIPFDAITLTGGYQYQVQAQSLHGKMFFAFKSGANRLHVWDGTSLRRTGMAEPLTVPTAVDTAVAGTFAGLRYYRTREIVMSGSVILRRSEPSTSYPFTPNGAFTGAVVTKHTDMTEGATHWELEASTNDADFYRVATTVVATATYTDTVVYGTGYATTGTLSEEIADYTNIPSVRFLLADEDRLIGLGNFEDDAYASRVIWTPVYNDPGKGNDERIPLDPVSFRDLDTYEGGGITGGIGPVNGEMWVFKVGHIYKMVRTNRRSSAYDIITITKKKGALPGSMVEGVDQSGAPCVFFLDRKVGPCVIGSDGTVQRCGRDIWSTWQTVNVNATNVVSRVVFREDVGQVQWHVATGSANQPDKMLVLHVEHMRNQDDGVRRGWAIWDGPRAAALAVCLYATNVDAGIARNRTLVPFIGLSTAATILRTDTTDVTDNGTAFVASMQSKPYAPASILHQFKVMNGALLATAAAGAVVNVTATRDFGLETISVDGVALDAQGDETQVIKPLNDLTFSELRTVDFTFSDGDETTRWEINQLALRETGGQTS